LDLLRGYVAAVVVVAICTAVNGVLSIWFAPTNLAMVYLLGVVLIAAKFTRGPSVICALLGVAAFDFFFVPPVYSFRFGDTQYLLAAVVLLAVGLIVSSLASHLRSQIAATTQAALAAQEERLRNSLLASISHDLRTPLAVIVGSASHLLENAQLTRDEQQKLLRSLYDEAHYVNRMVSDLLDMTRLQAGSVRLDRQWYPLEELVGAALERCKAQLQHHRVTIRLPAELPLIRVDGVLIEKLLINLLENAGKYTPRGTTIAISAERQAARLIVSVADQGPGVPAQLREKLFEKFYRGNVEGSIAGTGLGLTICRAIAQAHKGTIDASNRAEGGAIFALSLPYETPPALSEAAA